MVPALKHILITIVKAWMRMALKIADSHPELNIDRQISHRGGNATRYRHRQVRCW